MFLILCVFIHDSTDTFLIIPLFLHTPFLILYIFPSSLPFYFVFVFSYIPCEIFQIMHIRRFTLYLLSFDNRYVVPLSLFSNSRRRSPSCRTSGSPSCAARTEVGSPPFSLPSSLPSAGRPGWPTEAAAPRASSAQIRTRPLWTSPSSTSARTSTSQVLLLAKWTSV